MTTRVQTGMIVHSKDGERLGKIVRCDEDQLVIEKGFFFPTDFVCSTSNVAEVNGDDVLLGLTRVELETGAGRTARQPEAQAPLRSQTDRSASGRAATSASAGISNSSQQVRVPLAEEQLDVQKRARKSGDVRITKQVVTEQKQVTVPVTHEEVRVERVAASGGPVTGKAFENESMSVPIMEEEVMITKRPVVREELRVSKESHVEQRQVSETVRHETAEVEEESDEGTGYRKIDDDGHASHV